jgi:nicotinamide-nucleotide amidase
VVVSSLGGVMPQHAPLRTVEIIAVGSELLGTTRIDTNSLYLAGQLAPLGIQLRAKSVVGDDRAALAALITGALARADLLILTGGLGPTDDDLTREAVADVLGLTLLEDAAIVERIRARFASRGLQMPEINRRQAMVPEGATVLPNPHGTAPGLLIEDGDRVLLLLPGPPRELQAVLAPVLGGPLKARASGERIHSVSLFVTGRTESHVEEATQPLYSQWRTSSPPIETTILATPGQIELHLSLRSNDDDAAKATLANAQARLVHVLGDDVFSTDGRKMEEVLGDLLAAKGLTIAAAESCTGGLMMSRMTDVPGSSKWVIGGAVAYSDSVKTAFADVDPALIKQHGAVSEPVAMAMAEGIRARLGADIGVGITGIAGPTGGTPAKPVGTVAIAMVVPGGPARVRTMQLYGNRTQFKFNAAQTAMDMVRRALSRAT